MASVLVPNTVEAEILMTLDGEGVENTLWFFKAAGWDVESMTGLANGLITWWDGMSNPLSIQLVLNAVKVTDWTALDAAQVTVAPGSLFQGGQDSSNPAPNNVAPAITFHTGSRGRSFRGRNYIAGTPLAVIDSNDVSEAFAAALTASYNGLITVAADLSCTWVIASRYSGVEIVGGKKKPIPRSEGITTPVISASFKDLTVDSQRRRLPSH